MSSQDWLRKIGSSLEESHKTIAALMVAKGELEGSLGDIASVILEEFPDSIGDEDVSSVAVLLLRELVFARMLVQRAHEALSDPEIASVGVLSPQQRMRAELIVKEMEHVYPDLRKLPEVPDATGSTSEAC